MALCSQLEARLADAQAALQEQLALSNLKDFNRKRAQDADAVAKRNPVCALPVPDPQALLLTPACPQLRVHRMQTRSPSATPVSVLPWLVYP